MGKPPAVIIIARHGARLDAADKQWISASPTPYDPPLTYGGWTQCRALGAQIAHVLDEREAPLPERSVSRGRKKEPVATTHANGTSARDHDAGPGVRPKRDRKRKKYRVIIHSSPFLRCIQTSIAIGAGLAQYRGADGKSQRSTNHLQAGPSLFRGREGPNGTNGTNLSSVKESSTDSLLSPDSTPRADNGSQFATEKPDLRIDSFLGEWLTPDYFEKITPPPSSPIMLAHAKAELLRRVPPPPSLEEALRSAKATPGNFPGGWSNPGSPAPNAAKVHNSTRPAISDLPISQPKRDRSASHNSFTDKRSRSRQRCPSALLATLPSAPGGYIAPVPTYAISTSEPIPLGYVTHARDACIDIDFQWDSSQPPQNCGDGGEYGEEWSSMHKRFRGGLQNLVGWYEQTPLPKKRYSRTGTPLTPVFVKSKAPVDEKAEPADDDEEVETVLVLVSHGAGCNAMIGALTDQPVLMDVGLASLTIASRKDDATIEKLTRLPSYPVPSDLPIPRPALSSFYTMSLVASTAHLRSHTHTHTHTSSLPHLAPYPGRVDPPPLPLPRLTTAYMPSASTYRARLNSNSSTQSASSIHSAAEPPTFSWSPASHHPRPGAGGGTARVHRSATESSMASTGLWSKRDASPGGSPGGWGEGLREESREQSPIGGGRLRLGGLGRSNSGSGLWGAAASTGKLEEVKGRKEEAKAKEEEVSAVSGVWSGAMKDASSGAERHAPNGTWGTSPTNGEGASFGLGLGAPRQTTGSGRGLWAWSTGGGGGRAPVPEEAAMTTTERGNGRTVEDESALWRWHVGLADSNEP